MHLRLLKCIYWILFRNYQGGVLEDSNEEVLQEIEILKAANEETLMYLSVMANMMNHVLGHNELLNKLIDPEEKKITEILVNAHENEPRLKAQRKKVTKQHSHHHVTICVISKEGLSHESD